MEIRKNAPMRIKTVCLLTALFCSLTSFATITGKVFNDANANGKYDAGETGLANVLVSNGLSVVKTSVSGDYVLDGPVKNNFIFITIPNGYNATPFYRRVTEQQTRYDFAVQKNAQSKKKTVSFVHITDTETPEYGSWIDDIKQYVQNAHPDFIIHTGDICYDAGLHFHAENINTKTMGTPTFYCIGNHDLLKGEYGEEVYQSLFGPVYYSFEAGNVHFVVTPMPSGDHKPAYTKKDVYEWLKNDLKMKPKGQAVVIFNHDLLSNVDDSALIYNNDFYYKASDSECLNLSQQNLVAWVYGHWHTEMIQKKGNIMAVCASPPDKGGIDHSTSSFQVISVDEVGKVNIETKYTYQNKSLEIASPNVNMVAQKANGAISIVVNAYNTTSPVVSLKYAVDGNHEKQQWQPLAQQSSWSWQGEWKPKVNQLASYTITVKAILANGDTVRKTNRFTYSPGGHLRVQTGKNWPMFLQNIAHNPDTVATKFSNMQLAWVANAKAPVYNASPVIVNNLVITATVAEGNLNEGKIIAFHVGDGTTAWSVNTINAVKGPVACTADKVFALDVSGRLYAVDIKTGKLAWQKQLDFDFLPSNQVGVIISNDTIYAGSGKGLYALKATDGAVIWQNDAWSRADGSTANQTLAGNILIGSSNWSALFANNAFTGEKLWSRNDEGLRFRDAALSYVDGKLYATGGTKFFELDVQTGKNIRSMELPFGASGVKSFSTPLVTSDVIIFGTGNSGLIALNKETLDTKWLFATGSSMVYTAPYTKPPAAAVESSPVKIGGNIFFGASDGKLYLVDEQTGKLVWEAALGAPVFASPAISGNLLVATDFGGNVYGFRLN